MKQFVLGCAVYAILGLILADETIDHEDQTAREAENPGFAGDNDPLADRPSPFFDISSVRFENEPLRSDYNDHELAFIYSLYTINQNNRRRFNRINFKPKCYFENWTAACCINFNVTLPERDSEECKTCIETGLKVDKMQAFAALYFDDHELYEKDFDIGKICWSLPHPLSKIKICYWVYHLDISFENHRFESCALLEISPFFNVGFNCLLYEHGHFSIHDRIQPEHKGLFNLEVVGGRLKFEVESPSGKKIKYWFKKNWQKFKGLFRKKSAKFIAWLRRRH